MLTLIRARTLTILAAALLVFGGLVAPDVRAQDPAYIAGVRLLEAGVTVRRDGRHNALLRALRHLNDPTLRPLFASLADAEHPSLKVHGVLGLAELSVAQRLDLSRVAAIEEPAVQAELLGAALDSDLVPDEDARTLLSWADLDVGVKMLIATRMIEDGTFTPEYQPVLKEAAETDNRARASLASLLLLETGDESALAALHALNESQDPTVPRVKIMLLETAMRHELHAIAPWAYAVATDAETDPSIRTLAMRVAMRFGQRQAVAMWQRRFAEEDDLAERTRLTLIGLHLSPWLDPGLFEPLIRDKEPFIQQAGRTSATIARNDANLEEQVVALLQTYHPLAAQWALSYAQQIAEDEDAQQILLGLILLYEHGPERGREQRLADAVEATRALHDLAPEAARQFLRPVIVSPNTDNRLVQAILLGLVRAEDRDAGLVLKGEGDFANLTTNQLALLLRLRSGQELTQTQARDVSVLVRGGGGLQDQLRIQAGWQYLVSRGQAEQALRDALTTLEP
jgi:hypothetical protein